MTAERRRRPRSGFSLLELLVVIALVLVLVALLMPSMRMGTDRGKETVCRSNLRQIGMGALSYATETGFLPASYSGRDCLWPAQVRRHASESTGIFYCPMAPEEARWKVEFGSGQRAEWGYAENEIRLVTGGRGSHPFSYGHNNGGTADGTRPTLGVGDPWNQALRSRMAAPRNFMLIGDSLIDGIWDHFIDEDVPGEEPAVRHQNGAYIVFGDNHVEHIIPGPYLDLGHTGANDPELRRRWNIDNLPH